MTHIRLVNALKRAGIETQVDANRPDHFSARFGQRVLEWFTSHGDGLAHCVKVRNVNDHDDSMTDYYAGSWCRTIRQAVEWLQW